MLVHLQLLLRAGKCRGNGGCVDRRLLFLLLVFLSLLSRLLFNLRFSRLLFNLLLFNLRFRFLLNRLLLHFFLRFLLAATACGASRPHRLVVIVPQMLVHLQLLLRAGKCRGNRTLLFLFGLLLSLLFLSRLHLSLFFSLLLSLLLSLFLLNGLHLSFLVFNLLSLLNRLLFFLLHLISLLLNLLSSLHLISLLLLDLLLDLLLSNLHLISLLLLDLLLLDLLLLDLHLSNLLLSNLLLSNRLLLRLLKAPILVLLPRLLLKAPILLLRLRAGHQRGHGRRHLFLTHRLVRVVRLVRVAARIALFLLTATLQRRTHDHRLLHHHLLRCLHQLASLHRVHKSAHFLHQHHRVVHQQLVLQIRLQHARQHTHHVAAEILQNALILHEVHVPCDEPQTRQTVVGGRLPLLHRALRLHAGVQRCHRAAQQQNQLVQHVRRSVRGERSLVQQR